MRNIRLEKAMQQRKLLQRELAELVNDEIEALTGKRGIVNDRTVREWLSGKIRWPQAVRRIALEAVFECPSTELGFIPRGSCAPSPSSGRPEDPVLRRRFMTATAGTALAAASASVAPVRAASRVGTSDIERLQEKFAGIISKDHRYGGRASIESHAAALAGEALALQQSGTASQRVRAALYGCAASFTSSAMWAAIDGRRFDAAQGYFHRAVSLAAMAGDCAVQFRIWSHAGTLYRHLGRPADALSANEVARTLPIARRDAMFASLGHARQAAIHAVVEERHGVERALGHAADAHERAAPDVRPVWMAAVCDRAEIEELAVSAHLSLGNYAQAEAHAHRSLALFRPHMHRDRVLVTARLAHAQLGQGELEPALATAMSIPGDTATRHPRVIDLQKRFGARLRAVAPSSAYARAWDQYVHDSRKGSQ
ncbi:XRE family transcriptional regulator [Streptomyces noursei]|uniref:XRE family transcriptional regulator n=1 Tax=Streptomyces noursei TaxID=1971 RepID=UPI00332B0EE5